MEIDTVDNEVHVAGGVERYYGKGFQHLDSQFCAVSPFTPESIVAADQDRTPALNEGAFGVDISVCQTKSELIKSLDLKADAHAKAWGFKFSGSASFLQDISMTAETLAVSITAHRDLGERWLDSGKLELTEDAKRLISDNDRFREFYATYGGYFCVSYSRGGWVTILFMKECRSIEEKTTISASLKAESQTAGGDVTATSKFASKMASSGFSFKLHGDGHSPSPPTDFTIDKLIQWVANDWWNGLTPENATITGMSCDNLWQLPGISHDYDDFLRGPTQNMTELTDAKINCSSINQEADILSKDLRQNANFRQRSSALASNAKEAVKLLDNHVRTVANALDRKPTQTVLDGHEMPGDMQTDLDKLRSEADKREVVGSGDSFFLRTTGENNHFISGVKHGQVVMSANKSQALKVRFHTDGLPIRVGNTFRLALPSVKGKQKIVSAPGPDEWLKMATGKNKDRTWRIIGKRDKDRSTDIYYGDRIMVTNLQYTDMTIKSEETGGKHLAKAKGFTNHYLKIVKP